MPAKKKKAAKKKLTKLASKKSESTLDRKYKKYKEAINLSGGFISQVAALLGITHQAVSLYIKAHPELQEQLKAVDEYYLDFAENVLLGKISKGNLTATIYYLKCKGKGRGYIERFEHVDKTPGDPVKDLLHDVGKQVESNPDLKAKLGKELDD